MSNNLERFNSKVIRGSECWGWSGAISKKGYGCFWLDGKWIGAHVASYILHNALDIIPKGKQVLHKCDNKVCTKPSHLYLGTPSNNICDRYERATEPFVHKPYKINTDSQLFIELKDLYISGLFTYDKLSYIYNIPKTTIYRTVNRS